MPDAPGVTPESSPAKPTRLMSLDALRGFDMFWIVGADAVVEGLRKVSDSGFLRGFADQLQHVEWAGFHFEDLIFPMFVFIVGVSLVFSLRRTIEQKGRAQAVVRIFAAHFSSIFWVFSVTVASPRRLRESDCWACCNGLRSLTCSPG